MSWRPGAFAEVKGAYLQGRWFGFLVDVDSLKFKQAVEHGLCQGYESCNEGRIQADMSHVLCVKRNTAVRSVVRLMDCSKQRDGCAEIVPLRLLRPSTNARVTLLEALL